jgi:UDPglucose--hexose-1-phosphate uridylyltransferase
MANYISDITKTHWMVSNPDRLVRTGMNGKPFRCPFCSGNEADTPPEVYRVGEGEVNKPGWKIRVIPNLFPITDIHEVIIHSPGHDKNVEDLSPDQIEDIIKTYINRFNFLKDKGKIFIFSNQGLISGASLVHSHSQISVIPNDIPTDTLSAQPVVNIVEQIGEFVSYCPDYSEWAYETWIVKDQRSNIKDQKFEEMGEIEIQNLAKILQSSLIKLKKIHDANPHYSKKIFGYNFYIYPYENWYLRIIPRFMERAGFELSTGIMVNSVEAKKSAEELKKV